MRKNIDRTHLLKDFSSEITAFENHVLANVETSIATHEDGDYPALALFDDVSFDLCPKQFLYFTKEFVDSYPKDSNGNPIVSLKDVTSCRLQISKTPEVFDMGRDSLDFDPMLVYTFEFDKHEFLKSAMWDVFTFESLDDPTTPALELLTCANNPISHITLHKNVVMNVLADLFCDLGVQEKNVKAHKKAFISKMEELLEEMEDNNFYVLDVESNDEAWDMEYKKAKIVVENIKKVIQSKATQNDLIVLADLFYDYSKGSEDGYELMPICAFLNCFLAEIGLNIDLSGDVRISRYEGQNDLEEYFDFCFLDRSDIAYCGYLDILDLGGLIDELSHKLDEVRSVVCDWVAQIDININESAFGNGDCIVCCRDLR